MLQKIDIHIRIAISIVFSLLFVIVSRSYFDTKTIPDFTPYLSNIKSLLTFKASPTSSPTGKSGVQFIKPFPKDMSNNGERSTVTQQPAFNPTATPTDQPTPTSATQENNTTEPTPEPTTPPPSSSSSLSGSKLGIFLLSSYSQGAKQIIAHNPRVIKVMDPQSIPGLLSAVKEYKNNVPQGIVVLRIYENISSKHYSLSDDAQGAADDLFDSVIRPALDKLGNNISLFDYIETPNELDTTPGWDSVESASWLGRFWAELVSRDIQYGLKTCIASIPVGNPPGEQDEIQNKFQAFAPALYAASQNGGAMCYHSYTLHYTTDAGDEKWYSLRYRMLHNFMTNVDSSFSSLPFILSEGGVDESGNPESSGWQARGDAGQYTDWLNWYDGQLQQDGYVKGVTLFQIGNNHWSSFNLEPVASWLANHIAN